MRLNDLLSKEHVLVPLEVDSTEAALRRLVERFVEDGVLESAAALEGGRFPDPARDSIRIGHNALLAHFRSAEVRELAVALAVAAADLEPEGAEPEPGPGLRIVALVAGPPGSVDTHLRTVALIARVLRKDAVVQALLDARSADEVWAIDDFVERALPARLTVRDIMTQRVYRVYAETPLSELLSLMSRHRLRAVPVVADKREVVGIVSDRDVLRHLMPRVLRVSAEAGEEDAGARLALDEANVREIMSRSVMCISEDQSIAEVASLMVNKDVERFPVVREGQLTGFLTRGDIIRKMFG